GAGGSFLERAGMRLLASPGDSVDARWDAESGSPCDAHGGLADPHQLPGGWAAARRGVHDRWRAARRGRWADAAGRRPLLAVAAGEHLGVAGRRARRAAPAAR